jgi:hypothetical protein
MNHIGIRRTGKIKTLKKLNKQFKLGLCHIEELSTSQLAKLIFEIKVQNGLTIKKSSKLQITNKSKGDAK